MKGHQQLSGGCEQTLCCEALSLAQVETLFTKRYYCLASGFSLTNLTTAASGILLSRLADIIYMRTKDC